MIRVAFFVSILISFWHTAALAQNDLIPDRRAAITRDLDFYGSDLQAIFDTNLSACRQACLTDDRCVAFTFNSRSNSCFPKSEISKTEPYEGALSGRIYETARNSEILANQRSDELVFLTEEDFGAAYRMADELPEKFYPDEWSISALISAAQNAEQEGNFENAIGWTAAALVLSDRADHWLDYAWLNMTVKSESSSKTRRYRQTALRASINAYLRSDNPAQRASILSVMADALQAGRRGKTMIPALRLSYDLAPRDDTDMALNAAIAKYGFRVTETSVESDSADPRICANFSDPLAKNGVDYENFVQFSDTGLTVTASGSQLCVQGLQHGERYRFTLRQGLPSASGEALVKSVSLTQYVRDRGPVVRFPGRAYILPKTPDAGIPITTVNLTEVALKLRRVSDRNLVRSIQSGLISRPISVYQDDEFRSEVAEEIWTGTGQVQQDINQEVTTRLPMGDVVRDLDPGIYALQAAIAGADTYDNPPATQWFVISDLGATSLSGVDGLHVFVRSLADASAKVGVDVELLSNSNAVLANATSDANGYVRFAPGLSRGTGSARPAMLVMRDGENDLGFMNLSDPEFDLSDRGVEGNPPAPPIDVFLTTDRGAYRAGEVVNVTALLRDADAAALPNLPLTVVLTRPDGVEYSRNLSNADTNGGHVFSLPIAGSAQRGTWQLAAYVDPKSAALSRTQFLVEDFLPERIDFDLSLPDVNYRPGDAAALTVAARYLFGAPAADLPIEGEVRLRERREIDGFKGYLFGRHDEPFRSILTSFETSERTDADGHAIVAAKLPTLSGSPPPLEADFTVRVTEGSGRPVERNIVKTLAPSTALIGIKPLFDGVVPEGSEATFNLIALNKNLTQQAMPVKYTINRIKRRYQWYQQYGDWNWEPITTRERIQSGTVDLLSDQTVSVSSPVEWGSYEIKVESVSGEFIASSYGFDAGWYAPADASDTPDTLELSLDKPAYGAGDVATLRIVPRQAGIALINVMSNRLISMQAVAVDEGENLISLPVTDEWGAGAYVTASVVTPLDETKGQNPTRALGLAYGKVDPAHKALTVAFEEMAEASPRSPMNVVLNVDGIQAGETAYATIAAIDLGILNLTSFDSPDPLDHYFGQRRLGMGIRDVYGRLIDGMNGAAGTIRSGGDAAGGMKRQAPPPTEELVSYFSGPITVDERGRAVAQFDLPEFNGTVRLMAVVWSDTGIGQAEQDVLVRDPVVLTASLPRFMAPGDTATLRMDIVHASGPAGRIGLDVTTSNGLSLAAVPSGFDLAVSGTKQFSLDLDARIIGLQNVKISMTLPNGKNLTKTLMLPVQLNDPEVSTTRQFNLAAGDSFSFSNDVFADMHAGSGHAILTAGPLGRFDAPGLLQTLDRYPYGCTEQLTSKAMPLLYFDQVARVMGLDQRENVDTRISQAITAILANQSSNGAFGLWRPASGDGWLNAYVTDFLSRARAEGHNVPDRAFRMALDNLRNSVNYASDFDRGGENLAYALMVLAREGAASVGDLRYFADVKGDAFATPLAQAQMGAALAMYGDHRRADKMFALAGKNLAISITRKEAAVWRADYGTNLRDAAAVLTLASEAGSQVIDQVTLAQLVAQGAGRNRSTQESLWSLMAANALSRSGGVSQPLAINGSPADGPLIRMLENQSDASVDIQNIGSKSELLTLTTFGVPQVSVPAGGNGYAIKREYYTVEGGLVDLKNVQQGDRLVVVLRVMPWERAEARLMINDPLPAGFEIDNPNLLRAGDISDLGWLELNATPKNTEFRQDRFLAAVDWQSESDFSLAYIVRAVTQGAFHHPAASVEDMYRPQYRANSDAGRVYISQ